MNKQRRCEINTEIARLQWVATNLNKIKGDEEYSYDNIPENLQGTLRASFSEDAINSLDEAIENINNAIDNLSEII